MGPRLRLQTHPRSLTLDVPVWLTMGRPRTVKRAVETVIIINARDDLQPCSLIFQLALAGKVTVSFSISELKRVYVWLRNWKVKYDMIPWWEGEVKMTTNVVDEHGINNRWQHAHQHWRCYLLSGTTVGLLSANNNWHLRQCQPVIFSHKSEGINSALENLLTDTSIELSGRRCEYSVTIDGILAFNDTLFIKTPHWARRTIQNRKTWDSSMNVLVKIFRQAQVAVQIATLSACRSGFHNVVENIRKETLPIRLICYLCFLRALVSMSTGATSPVTN